MAAATCIEPLRGIDLVKQELREKIWEAFEKARVTRFPGARGRIPNFIGAEACADRLRLLAAWERARAIKANPDSPQRAVRHLALKEGKTVYMAVPRLRDEKCFIELDPARLGGKLYEASSIKGAFKLGRPVTVRAMKPIDLIVCGSVAVTREGARVGKGGGYSDLEYGLATEFGKISPKTPIVTTVHPLQVVDDEIQLQPHDIPLDYIVTPTEVIRCAPKHRRPKGIYWEFLTPDQLAKMPALKGGKQALPRYQGPGARLPNHESWS